MPNDHATDLPPPPPAASSHHFRTLAVVTAIALLAVLVALFFWELVFVRMSAFRDPLHVRRVTVARNPNDRRTLVIGPESADWTPLEKVSAFLVLGVVEAEDPCFFAHVGFDWSRLRKAAHLNFRRRAFVRGASTITNQLMKNLFLWTGKSITRKVLEGYLTWRAEHTLSKKRILELYLNLAQWGRDVYGVAEASRHYFAKAPASLNPEESAWLAAVLPNPERYASDDYRGPTMRRTEDILKAVLSRLENPRIDCRG